MALNHPKVRIIDVLSTCFLPPGRARFVFQAKFHIFLLRQIVCRVFALCFPCLEKNQLPTTVAAKAGVKSVFTDAGDVPAKVGF